MRNDPYIAFNYRVEIGQVVVAGFSEVGGLAIETEVESFREGGRNDREVQLPGVSKFPSKIVLKRGLGDKHDLWDWYSQIRGGDVQRKDLAITLLDHAGETTRRWTFRQACPIKWTGPELKAQTAAIAFESVEFIHRGLTSAS
ncbi:MAG: phage tail protein [Burkholderiaceae bacterium]